MKKIDIVKKTLISKKIYMFKYDYKKPKVIAEIGCNHMWKVENAKHLVFLAKQSGATVAKFQKRTPRELLSEEQYNAPHPVPANSYWKTYWEHREYLELSINKHKEIKKYCEEIWIIYSTSVWDLTSTKEVISINPELIKVWSATNNKFDVLKLLRDEYKWEVHLSFWMTTHEEEEKIISFFEETNSAKERLIIYSCTSWYPVPFDNVSLLEINRLYEKYWNRVKEIGFSGHHLGIAIDIAAYTLWARWIERHFTSDRTLKWTDHAASLEPSGITKLIRDLNATYKSLTYKEKEILEIEQVQRDKLKEFKK